MTYIPDENMQQTSWKESIIIGIAVKNGYQLISSSPTRTFNQILFDRVLFNKILFDPEFWKTLVKVFPHESCHPSWILLAQYFFNHSLTKGWDVAVHNLHEEITNHTCALCPNQSQSDNIAHP